MYFKKFVMAYDHRVDVKYIDKIKAFLSDKGLEFFEVKTDNNESNDYPIIASKAHEIYLKENDN